mmetsp:Transcript_43261/g.85347  ORF Transcript_43261/g.85347 Transcript_43261/m.85347 type:complete len:357 (-) Transcript_43261:499-1569(-)
MSWHAPPKAGSRGLDLTAAQLYVSMIRLRRTLGFCWLCVRRIPRRVCESPLRTSLAAKKSHMEANSSSSKRPTGNRSTPAGDFPARRLAPALSKYSTPFTESFGCLFVSLTTTTPRFSQPPFTELPPLTAASSPDSSPSPAAASKGLVAQRLKSRRACTTTSCSASRRCSSKKCFVVPNKRLYSSMATRTGTAFKTESSWRRQRSARDPKRSTNIAHTSPLFGSLSPTTPSPQRSLSVACLALVAPASAASCSASVAPSSSPTRSPLPPANSAPPGATACAASYSSISEAAPLVCSGSDSSKEACAAKKSPRIFSATCGWSKSPGVTSDGFTHQPPSITNLASCTCSTSHPLARAQ